MCNFFPWSRYTAFKRELEPEGLNLDADGSVRVMVVVLYALYPVKKAFPPSVLIGREGRSFFENF